MKEVMVFGTFAILHPGHLYFFLQAKKYGDYLIVVIGRDLTVKKIKGFRPKLSEKARCKMVGALKIINKAVLGDKKDWYKLIVKYKPDVICLGYDQAEPENFQEELRNRGVYAEVRRLGAYKPKKYKSSKILNN